MSACASVTTAKAPAAIAAIHLEGPGAAGILRDILPPPAGKPHAFQPGDVTVTHIVDGVDILDHVVIACPHPETYEINCHGNPLIVAAVMRLLENRGARLVSAEQMLCNRFAPLCETTIELEARLAQLTVATFAGANLIAAQIHAGLVAAAKQWSDDLNLGTTELNVVRRQAGDILRRGRIARPLIHGLLIVLAGPPNSGKSTLLNALAGRPQAIVADIPGTTRDWVTAACSIGSLAVEFIDTAGLDSALTCDPVDRDAQAGALKLLSACDLVLYVIDGARPGVINPIAAQSPAIVVFNKSDLPARVTSDDLTFQPAATVAISALRAAGIDELALAIQTVLAVDDLKSDDPICFTDRQAALLTQLTDATDTSQAKYLIAQLLNAPLSL
ncbi:MAG: 50S ribosome-binding GTPase [Phycisphaerae bacterium]|nr:50S ribosome-binding GTPase [Phycisphaerae bacterium]